MALGTSVDLKVGTTITQVDNYSSLPLPTSVPARYYWVSNSQGVKWVGVLWGGNYYPRGLYYSNGVSWEYLETPIQATQAEVDAGVVTDKFVTPETFDGASKWATKEDVSNKTSTIVGNETSVSLYTSVKGVVDWVTLLFVPKTRNITINGTTQDLSADRSWTISNSPAGSDKEIQFNNSGSFGSATNAIIQDEELAFPDIQNPSNPTNALKTYGKKVAERFFMTTKDPNGFENFIQPSLFTENIQLYKAAGSVNQMNVIGGPALTATGTAAGSTIATTNIYTQSRILEYLQTTPGTTNVAGFRTSNAQFFRGASASQGGFFFVCRWAPSTGVATATNRACVGMHNVQTAPTDVEPSTILNQLTMGWDSADTNIQIMSNSGTGTATKKDLGASFPVPTSDRTKVYEVIFHAPPGSSFVYWVARDIGTGATASGTLDSAVDKVPSSTTLLGLRGYMSAGGTSSVIGIGLVACYVSSNY